MGACGTRLTCLSLPHCSMASGITLELVAGSLARLNGLAPLTVRFERGVVRSLRDAPAAVSVCKALARCRGWWNAAWPARSWGGRPQWRCRRRCESRAYLCLPGCNLHDDGVSVIVSGITRLRHLDISSNSSSITDACLGGSIA